MPPGLYQFGHIRKITRAETPLAFERRIRKYKYISIG
jgi:hypothetical protein